MTERSAKKGRRSRASEAHNTDLMLPPEDRTRRLLASDHVVRWRTSHATVVMRDVEEEKAMGMSVHANLRGCKCFCSPPAYTNANKSAPEAQPGPPGPGNTLRGQYPMLHHWDRTVCGPFEWPTQEFLTKWFAPHLSPS